MRRTLAALAALTVVLGGAAAVLAGPAAAAGAAAGTYVATTPTRVLDTRHGTYGNRKGSLAANRGTVVKVTGRSGVPATAASVAVTISVVGATRSGGITASTYGVHRRPNVTNVQFRAKGTATGAAVVRLRAGRIDLWNHSSGRVHLVVDVVGYYAGGTPVVDGALRQFTPRRVIDTRVGLHRFHKGAVRSRATLNANLHSLAGLPATAGAVAATVTITSASRSGSLVAYATRTTRPAEPLLDFTAGRAVSQYAVLALSDVQGLSLYNASPGSVHVVVDVQGYLTGAPAAVAGGTQVVAANRVAVDTYVPAGATDTIRVLGRGGVPRSGVRAVTVSVRVRAPKRAGALAGSTRQTPRIVSFAAGQSVAGTATLRVVKGAIKLRNVSTGRLGLVVDVLGYVPSTSLRAPSAKSVARYPNDLTADVAADRTRMRAHGGTDAAATFVLLDLGAQTVTPPMSTVQPGIAIALTDPTVRLKYADLVSIIEAYVDGLATGGHAVTLAVGTNNDGTWTTYGATARGKDFAQDVINPLITYAAPKRVTVVGANDIEADFGTQRASDAIAWETAYLRATPADLVFNGALNDCPTVFGSKAACAFGWTQANYGTLTKRVEKGRNRIKVLPQIYFPVQAVQWANLYANVGGGLLFVGSLTQYRADRTTYKPAQGWAALVRALQWRVTSPAVPRAVDIGADA